VITARRSMRWVVLALFTPALVAMTLAEPGAAQFAPTGGIVEVTGYGHITPADGSTEPVTVIVKPKEAAAIRAALAGLSAKSSVPLCMESESDFRISFLAHPNGQPTYVATEDECPTPGVVNISVGRRMAQHLQEDCALRVAVVTSGRNEAKRESAEHGSTQSRRSGAHATRTCLSSKMPLRFRHRRS
jgi:hypothetical protein